MALAVAARPHGDGHPCQHHGNQAGQSQILLRPVQRGSHCRPVLTHIQESMARLQPRLQPGFVRPGSRFVTRQQITPPNPAARLHHLGAGHFIQIDQHPGIHAVEGGATIRLVTQNPGHAKLGTAHFQGIP